ncbi:MAG: DNRLRE domain-containing protein [Ruminococcaceae bacterium]|nr:DNRLRE domain-containing protein [Oscillospiraceae bacterium]
MKKIFSLLLAATMLLSLALLEMPVFAANEGVSQTILVSADGCFDYYGKNNNGEVDLADWDGASNSLRVTYKNSPTRVAYLQFDISSVENMLSAGYIISKALVKLTTSNERDQVSEQFKIALYPHDSNSWSENATSLSDLPDPDNTDLTNPVSVDPEDPLKKYVIAPTEKGKEFSMDITEYLDAVTQNGNNLISLEMGFRNEWQDNSTSVFYSREATSGYPVLYVEYIKKEFSADEAIVEKGTLKKIGEYTVPVIENTSSGDIMYISEALPLLKDAVIAALTRGETELSLNLWPEDGTSRNKAMTVYCTGDKAYTALLIKFNDGTPEKEIKVSEVANAISGEGIPTAANRYQLRTAASGYTVTRTIFDKFNLSEIQGKIDAIDSVSLKLFTYKQVADVKCIIGIYQTDAQWSSQTLTWANMDRNVYETEITRLEEAKVKVSSTVTNNLDVATPVCAAFALYRKFGEEEFVLSDVKIKSIASLAVGTNTTIFEYFNIPASTGAESYVGKIIILDGLEKLVPLTEAKDF